MVLFMENKKASIGQNFFYIMMAFAFVWILVFGYSKMSAIGDTLSEQERIDIKNEFEELVEFCMDPLNKGSEKYISIKHQSINAVCFLDENYESSNFFSDELNFEELDILYENGNNIVLLDSSFDLDGKINSIDTITDSVSSNYEFSKTSCWNSNSGSIKIQYTCN